MMLILTAREILYTGPLSLPTIFGIKVIYITWHTVSGWVVPPTFINGPMSKVATQIESLVARYAEED